MGLHCVYYCYNADKEIIYIGCTKRILDRLSQHRSQSAWVHELHDVKLRWFNSFRESRRFEENSILKNRPEYNRLVASERIGRRFWVKVKREVPALDANCLERIKLIRLSLKKRLAARIKKNGVES